MKTKGITTPIKPDVETPPAADVQPTVVTPNTDGDKDDEDDTKTPPADDGDKSEGGPPASDVNTALEESGATSWDSVIVLVRGDIPENVRRPVIVVQSTEREPADSSAKGEADFGTHRNPSMPPIAATTYPEGAAAYFTMDEVDFGVGRSPVVAVGVGKTVQQAGFEQFSDRRGYVHVGPSSPIYAAANYAFTLGAKRIELVGLSEEERTVLRPWFDAVSDKVEIIYS